MNFYSELIPYVGSFIAYFVLGIAGFGSALILVPLLSLHQSLSQVIPTVLLLDLFTSLILGKLHFRKIDFQAIQKITPFMLLGILIGSSIYNYFDSVIGSLILGIYVFAIGLKGFFRNKGAFIKLPKIMNLWVMGVLIGIVEFTMGTSGPLIASFYGQKITNHDTLRVNVSTAVLIVVVMTLLYFGLQGRLSSQGLWLETIHLTPFAILGVYLGNLFTKKISESASLRVFYLVLILSAIITIFSIVA